MNRICLLRGTKLLWCVWSFSKRFLITGSIWTNRPRKTLNVRRLWHVLKRLLVQQRVWIDQSFGCWEVHWWCWTVSNDFFLWAAQSNLLFYNEWYLKPLRELKIETIVLRSIFACAVQNETVTWRPRDWWKRSHTKEALYENLFLRQQDLQLSPPRANQTCCTEVRKPQSISNACNEKHIFVCQWKDNQQLNKGVNGFPLQGCSETNNTNLYQPLWLQFWILKQGYLKTSKTLTQLLAVVLISEYVYASYLYFQQFSCVCYVKHPLI